MARTVVSRYRRLDLLISATLLSIKCQLTGKGLMEVRDVTSGE